VDEARAALAHWPAPFRAALLVPLGNAGGFSGALLWRVSTPSGDFCLRAAAPTSPARFEWMRQAREAGLSFVPTVVPATNRSPTVEHAGRSWELQQWMPGRADYRGSPSEVKLRAACSALARLHRAWGTWEKPWPGVVPAVARRVEALKEPTPDARLSRLAGGALREIQSWAGPPPRMRPCLCDIWHDHVLFTGDEVTGVVDYAAMRVDAAAADVARLLGSLVGDDEDGWRVGLAAYEMLTDAEARLARLLDRAGTIAAASRWQRWLNEGRVFADPVAARRRAEEVLRRVRGWA
jgi:Ser/Thr protein kinase RdoA (MazF antagonist)